MRRRNEEIHIDEISKQLMIDAESIGAFAKDLMAEGLLTNAIADEKSICKYRQSVVDCRLSQPHEIDKTTTEKLPMDMSSAERLYQEKAGAVASVMFELTYRCSEMCIHCYNIGATRNDEEESHRADVKEVTLD